MLSPSNWKPSRRANIESAGDGGGHVYQATTWSVLTELLFWSWNGMLSAVAVFGLAPMLGIFFVRDVVRGTLPLSFLAALALLIVMPLIGLFAGMKARRNPWRLLAILYGVEIPTLVIGVVRIFILKELTTQLIVAGAVVIAGLAAFAVTMWLPRERRRGVRAVALFAGVAILGTVTVAFASLMALYGFPLLAMLLQHVGDIALRTDPTILLYGLFALTIALYVATVAVASPFIATAVYAIAVKRLVVDARRKIGVVRLSAVTVAVALFAGGIIYASSIQPHERAFGILEHTPSDDQQRRDLLAKSDAIRSGLLDAYLAPYRYATTADSHSTIADMYAEAFGGSAEDYTTVASTSNFLLAPFLFNATEPQERIADAAAKYAAFFDEPVESAETARITAAMTSSFDRSRVEASLLDRNAERVYVKEQALTVTPHGDWASVELHEAYINTTEQTEEILYHFELPESAAVTGLWLGDNADKARASAFTVTPRGAAQKVYKQEVRRGVDPALLEQVGPRQYRLRVFPILAETLAEAAPTMHLWLTFDVLRENGRYPLPHLTERRNAFFDAKTHRTWQNANADWSDWLPESVPAESTPFTPRTVRVDGFNVRRDQKPQAETLHGRHIAVVVDRTRSMEKHSNALTLALTEIAELAKDNGVELVLPAPAMRGEDVTRQPFGPMKQIVFYGGQALSEMIRQSASDADLTLVLTDDDGVKHETSKEPIALKGALWIVHLDRAFPAAYSDDVTALTQRPLSGIAGNVSEALESYAAARHGLLLDGDYAWSLTKDAGSPAHDGIDALAARALVRLAGQGFVSHDMHRIAVDHAIVTPLSSMIVLVNDRQREALEAASNAPDAFERDTETGTQPPPFMNVTGVPEPEEWLLIAIVSALLLVAAKKRFSSSGALQHGPAEVFSRARFG